MAINKRPLSSGGRWLRRVGRWGVGEGEGAAVQHRHGISAPQCGGDGSDPNPNVTLGDDPNVTLSDIDEPEQGNPKAKALTLQRLSRSAMASIMSIVVAMGALVGALPQDGEVDEAVALDSAATVDVLRTEPALVLNIILGPIFCVAVNVLCKHIV